MILNDLLQNIEGILDRITTSKLNAYALTQNRLRQVDVSTDELYQRTYNGFYRVRLPLGILDLLQLARAKQKQ